MNADCLVMLGKLQAAISARKWRLAYAWADALDALIDANQDDLPYLILRARSVSDHTTPVS